MSDQEHKRRAISGSLFVFFGYGGSQVLRLASNLILGHLLFPAAFGLMALVNVVIVGISLFFDIGIGQSIIQNKRGNEPAFLNTAWTMQVIRGVVTWFLICLAAWPAALYFHKNDPMAYQLLWILPVIGFTSVLNGFTSSAIFTLNRDLKLGMITIIDILSQLFALVVTIAWACIAPSVWALVAGNIASYFVRVPMSHFVNRPFRNSFAWDKETVREISHFGKWILFSTIVGFLAGNLDRILLGRLLTLKELGLYSIALTFAGVGIDICAKLGANVLFPMVSKFREDTILLISHSIKTRGVLLLAAGALTISFTIVAPVFFKYCYDARYASAGVIAQWLSIFIWCSIIKSTIDFIPLGLGDSRLVFWSNVVRLLGYAFAIPAYQYAGLPGFIIAISLGPFLGHFLIAWFLPTGRWRMMGQSVLYTVFLAIAWVAYRAGVTMIGKETSQKEILVSVGSALLICAVTGLVFLRKMSLEKKSIATDASHAA